MTISQPLRLSVDWISPRYSLPILRVYEINLFRVLLLINGRRTNIRIRTVADDKQRRFVKTIYLHCCSVTSAAAADTISLR